MIKLQLKTRTAGYLNSKMCKDLLWNTVYNGRTSKRIVYFKMYETMKACKKISGLKLQLFYAPVTWARPR